MPFPDELLIMVVVVVAEDEGKGKEGELDLFFLWIMLNSLQKTVTHTAHFQVLSISHKSCEIKGLVQIIQLMSFRVQT